MPEDRVQEMEAARAFGVHARQVIYLASFAFLFTYDVENIAEIWFPER